MDIYNCVYKSGTVKLDGPVDYRWVSAHELSRYPFPGADRKFMALISDPL
jgi:A/G-specific adenine glycosylase